MRSAFSECTRWREAAVCGRSGSRRRQCDDRHQQQEVSERTRTGIYGRGGALARGPAVPRSRRIKWDTHAFVRHQGNWFRRAREAHTFDVTDLVPTGDILQLIQSFPNVAPTVGGNV